MVRRRSGPQERPSPCAPGACSDAAARGERGQRADLEAAAHQIDETGKIHLGAMVPTRWTLLHTVVEGACHGHHAHLPRERIDGATGYR